jgi:hypothetical protein
MPIRKQKEPMMTRLDSEDADWIQSQVIVYGNVSTVLNRVVKVLRAAIRKGILKWDFAALQELLQENQEVQCNFAASSPAKAERTKRIRPIRLPNVHLFTSLRSFRTGAEAAGMAALRTPFRGGVR